MSSIIEIRVISNAFCSPNKIIFLYWFTICFSFSAIQFLSGHGVAVRIESNPKLLESLYISISRLYLNVIKLFSLPSDRTQETSRTPVRFV